jgi:hypothetical protein
MEYIYAILLDVDGTLMPQGGPSLSRMMRFLRYLKKTSLKVCVASGKGVSYCTGLGCGGGFNWDAISAETGGQFHTLISTSPPVYQQHRLPNIDKDLGRFIEIIDYRLIGRTFQFYDRIEYFRPELKEGIITLFPPGVDREVTLPWLLYFEGIIKLFKLNLKAQRHSDGCIDIVPSAVSKALSIKNTCSFFEITPNRILTAVDGKNDLELTQGGVIPIAVNNAVSEIKEAVKSAGGYIAKSDYGDGVIEGMKFYAREGRFEPEVAKVILSF